MRDAILTAILIIVLGACAWGWVAWKQDMRELEENLSKRPTTLLTCAVCKGKVASSADKCPHCGDPR